jgi:signal transduction histidine kinase
MVESTREAEARAHAEQRLRRQRDTLRPLGVVVIAAVTIGAINGHPAPADHGEGLGVSAALAVFAIALAVTVRTGFVSQRHLLQGAVIALMGAAGVALVALQPRGTTALAVGAAVWMAVTRLGAPAGFVLAASATAGVALAEALGGGSASVVLASVLLCAVLALAAYFLMEARASQNTTELLLAQLEDAREQQLQAAALTERGRIAGELHDVLAHSLSGAAIQLEGARKLAEREQVSQPVHAAIERAGELVRDGLVSARHAVAMLRGDGVPGVDQLDDLVEAFRNDARADVTLRVEGEARRIPSDASLALYRGAQEALTNVSRYAPGAATSVVLRYGADSTALFVEDRHANGTSDHALANVGGGNGLQGMRERFERLGGRIHAGPTDTGWRVELEVPG